MHIIKLKECVMRINKRAQIFFYFLSHFLLTISGILINITGTCLRQGYDL